MPKKIDCINFIPPTGKDDELCRIRNDWCVPCETCEQYESFASWLDKKHKNISSPITRGDLIRRMTDEELANEIYGWVLMYMPTQLKSYLEITRCSILDKIKQELKEREE